MCHYSMDHLEPHEDFIGLPSADANAIIKDVPLRLNIPISNCRGQCYGGAAVMRAVTSGVSTQVANDEP